MDMVLPAAARRKGDHGDASAASGGLAAEDGTGGEVPTFGQQLTAMAGSAEGRPAKGKRPSAASQVALLVQALQNSDAAMLDQVPRCYTTMIWPGCVTVPGRGCRTPGAHLLHACSTPVTRLLHACCTPVARLLHACYTPMYRLLHTPATRLLPASYTRLPP